MIPLPLIINIEAEPARHRETTRSYAGQRSHYESNRTHWRAHLDLWRTWRETTHVYAGLSNHSFAGSRTILPDPFRKSIVGSPSTEL